YIAAAAHQFDPCGPEPPLGLDNPAIENPRRSHHLLLSRQLTAQQTLHLLPWMCSALGCPFLNQTTRQLRVLRLPQRRLPRSLAVSGRRQPTAAFKEPTKCPNQSTSPKPEGITTN